MIMNLNFNEKFIVMSLRTFFNFFSKSKYHIVLITYNDRDGDVINFQSFDGKRGIEIALVYYEDGCSLEIVFRKKNNLFNLNKKFFHLSKIMKSVMSDSDINFHISDENLQAKMEEYLNFIKKYLMPVINGNKWIDEIFKEMN